MENTQNVHRLYRSRTNKMIGGVAGGLAEYFNVDVILMRLLFVILFVAGGSGVLIYIILWIITPLEPYSRMEEKLNPDIKVENKNINTPDNNNRTFIIGVSLIVLGFIFLFNSLFPQFNFSQLWPLVLIVIGVMLIINESPGNKNSEVSGSGNKKDNTGDSNEVLNPDSINKKNENNEI